MAGGEIPMGPLGLFVLVIAAVFVVSRWINILQEYERAVTFFLGRAGKEARGPGLVFIYWPFERMVRVDLRTQVLEIPPQDVITRDNVSVRVSAVVYFRVLHPVRAIVEVGNYLFATMQLAQTTLRSVLGQADLDELLSARERQNARLQEIIDAHTDPWGIKVAMVEVKQVDLPQEMQRAMARQAEAEREKRAKIIHASGELEASSKLAEAADVMSHNPMTLQLRYLQTLTEISAEKNSTILFPVPIELMRSFLGKKSE
jgi:regulator of protease activity HflC (stomatin/prohibitin superfamily)